MQSSALLLPRCHLREKELLPLLEAFEGCRKPSPQHGLGVHRADVRGHALLKLAKQLLLHRLDVRQPEKVRASSGVQSTFMVILIAASLCPYKPQAEQSGSEVAAGLEETHMVLPFSGSRSSPAVSRD